MDPTSSLPWDEQVNGIIVDIQEIYKQVVEPVSSAYQYDLVCPSDFSNQMVQKKPLVTFLGPFSAGKSTFINYLVQQKTQEVGPQPVTDRFTIIMDGDQKQRIPGRVMVSSDNLPFRDLSQFGDSFIDSFEGVVNTHPILKLVNFVDTPGILETATVTHARRFDFIHICQWFVEKSDLVYVMFDPTKLDAGPELRELFKVALQKQTRKLRFVLNKADIVSSQELLRVYGSLYWNLSSLISSTEPPRVYVSSFWENPYQPGTDKKLFDEEKAALLLELTDTVPLQSLDHRVTRVMKRVQQVMMHAIICAHFKTKKPVLIGKDKFRQTFAYDMESMYPELANQWKMLPHDFPDYNLYMDSQFFQRVKDDFPDTKSLQKKNWLNNLRELLEDRLPKMLTPIQNAKVADPRDRANKMALQSCYLPTMQAT